LHSNLIEFEDACDETWPDEEDEINGGQYEQLDVENEMRNRGVDKAELPLFEGSAPESTAGVWSWDKDYLLVGVGPFREWNIIDRKGR
jgi:hypothetical protein